MNLLVKLLEPRLENLQPNQVVDVEVRGCVVLVESGDGVHVLGHVGVGDGQLETLVGEEVVGWLWHPEGPTDPADWGSMARTRPRSP